MVEDMESLEFTLTRSMTYTLIKLSDLMKKRDELIDLNDGSDEIKKELNDLEYEIAKLKEEFVFEFRLENRKQIENYWYLRSKE